MCNYNRTVCYLTDRFKYNLKQGNKIIARYGNHIGKPKPENATIKYYKSVSDEIGKDFWKFILFTKTIKDDYKRDFKTKRSNVKRYDYDDSFQEMSFDGSFAYNGVTEDF